MEVEVADDPYDCVRDAHCVVFATEWDEFESLSISIACAMRWRLRSLSTRNLFDPQTMAEKGFVYLPTGRPARRPE